jgi:hypothetical protein
MPMLATDSRSRWDGSTLPSAQHYWDGRRSVGRWLADQDLGGLGYAGVVWDAYFLFGRDGHWLGRPAAILASGSPVISSTGPVTSALDGIGGTRSGAAG